MPDSSDHSTTGSPEKTSDTKRRIDGVRPCLECGHDLHGQPIERAEALGLFFARCPECGTAAPLVEQPVLGPWGRRVGTVLLMTLVLFIVTIALITVLILFGTSMAIADESMAPARAAASSLLPTIDPVWWIENQDSIDPVWWIENQDTVTRAIKMTSHNPWNDTDVRGMALVFGPLTAFLGVAWSGLLLSVPRRRLPWVAVIANGLAFVMILFFIFVLNPMPEITGPRANVSEVTYRVIGPGMTARICLAQMLIMTVGLLVGRSLLRRTACFLLPPRSRTLLRVLWDADGLKLPSHRG